MPAEFKRMTRVQTDEPVLTDLGSVLAAARAAADRTRLNKRLLDHLYAHSRSKGASRESWEADVRYATALQKLLRDTLVNLGASLLDAADRRRRLQPRGRRVEQRLRQRHGLLADEQLDLARHHHRQV